MTPEATMSPGIAGAMTVELTQILNSRLWNEHKI